MTLVAAMRCRIALLIIAQAHALRAPARRPRALVPLGSWGGDFDEVSTGDGARRSKRPDTRPDFAFVTTRHAPQQRYFASSARGCELNLAEELETIGAVGVEIGRSGVHFDGPTKIGYRAVVELRTATRVLEVLAWRDQIETAADLYNLGREVPWPELMDVEGTLRVDATVTGGVSQALSHSHFSSLTLKNAVVDAFRSENQLGARPSVAKEGCDVPLHVFLDRDRCTVYRSLSSESLHKRGYRSATSHRAALRPTVAAAMLLAAQWPARSARGEALCDPMCGSGTFLIEAALMARGIAPGLARARNEGFACERWKDFDATAWAEVITEAKKRVLPRSPARIHGADAHAGAAGLARDGLANAGVDKDVSIAVADAAQWSPPDKPALVISNPPWDGRLDGADAAWTALRSFLKREAGGGVAHLLSGNMPVTRNLMMRASKKRKLSTGGVDLTCLTYEIRGEVDSAPLIKAPADVGSWLAPPRSNYEALTVVVLKEKLRDRSLKVSGRKVELVDRLLEADARVLEGA